MKDTYKNILVIVCGFLVLAFVFLYKGYVVRGQLFLGISLSIGIASLLFPILAQWIVTAWFKLAEVMGWFSSRIILSIVFYLFLFPIATLASLFTKDPLALKKHSGNLFVERNHKYISKDLEFPW